MVKVPPRLLEAIDRYIGVERPGISRPEALRLLASHQLKTLGIMDLLDEG
jgi:hypothetical protein